MKKTAASTTATALAVGIVEAANPSSYYSYSSSSSSTDVPSGAICGSHSPRHKSRLGWIRSLYIIRCLPGKRSGRLVQFIDDRLQAVVSLGNASAVERVGFNNVGAGLEIGLVDAVDDFRLREARAWVRRGGEEMRYACV